MHVELRRDPRLSISFDRGRLRENWHTIGPHSPCDENALTFFDRSFLAGRKDLKHSRRSSYWIELFFDNEVPSWKTHLKNPICWR